jgi:glutaminyl-tRNA synthetase
MYGFCGGKDLVEGLNLNSRRRMTASVGSSLGATGTIATKADDKFQFERLGYFEARRVDHSAAKRVFNLALGLKDARGK